MSTLDIQDFERDPIGSIDRVTTDDPLTILRGGRPIVEVHAVPVASDRDRPIGLAAGAFVVPDDFNAPLSEDVVGAFEAR